MADQRKFAHLAVAFSSLVVATCAVVVTVKVMSTDGISVKPHRTLDPAAVERQVLIYAQGLSRDATRVSCPIAVPAVPQNRFTCQYQSGYNTKMVQVTVTN